MYKEYVGNLHIHSTYSDGTATIDEIAAAARRAGLDFVGINDHYHLRGLREGKERFHDGVAVLIGSELNQKFNHYLAYDIAEEIESDTENPQSVIDAVNAQGGLGFIAHPYEIGSPVHDNGHTYIWKRWDATGVTGISIWNFSSIWKGNARSIASGLYYYHNMRAANLDPLDEALAKWDELTQSGKVVAIGGSDNHGVKFRKFLGLVRGMIFDYEYVFRAVNTHVLLPDEMPSDFGHARRALYDALREGRCFVACSLFADPRGFRYYAESDGAMIPMGSDVSLKDSPILKVNAPARGLIRFIQSGREIMSETGTDASLRIDAPGPCRVEVHLPHGQSKNRAWIFSNPIYVR
jgi:hypothetical protein